jgi:hypothetical protein
MASTTPKAAAETLVTPPLPDPANEEWEETEPEQKEKVRPQHPPVHALRGLKHVVMVVPVKPYVNEGEHIGAEQRQFRPERIHASPLRNAQLQHHDGDDDRDHRVREGV